MTQAGQSGAGTRAEFLGTMRDLRASFEAVGADVARRHEAFEQALHTVSEALRAGVGRAVLKADHPLARAVADVNDEALSLVGAWMERVGEAARALELRNGSKDALLVYVLGKVKAGKSSLGNVVAYGRCIPPLPERPDPVPHFFTEANMPTNGLAPGSVPFFAVGAVETTTRIQGFRLAGLTWIDAPGLASVTPESGALASEYVESADLVIYPMHSGSPGQSDDADEVRKLVRACRRFMVVITCCDRWEEDEAPDGQVVGTWAMKPDRDRAAQIRWVQQQLAAAGAPADTEVVTLSTRYADAHAACPEALARSGLTAFYERLQQVARSEAVCLKRQVPSRNLDALVDGIIGAGSSDDTGELAVRGLEGKLRALLTGRIAQARRDLAQRQRKLLAGVQAELPTVVGGLIEVHAPARRSLELRAECHAALHDLVSGAIRREVLALLGDAGGAMVPSPALHVAEFPPFMSITREAQRSNRSERGAAGAAAGAFAGGLAGAELGALAGFVFPGPGNAIGAALGGIIGAAAAGWGGRWAGRMLGTEWNAAVAGMPEDDATEPLRALSAGLTAERTRLSKALERSAQQVALGYKRKLSDAADDHDQDAADRAGPDASAAMEERVLEEAARTKRELQRLGIVAADAEAGEHPDHEQFHVPPDAPGTADQSGFKDIVEFAGRRAFGLGREPVVAGLLALKKLTPGMLKGMGPVFFNRVAQFSGAAVQVGVGVAGFLKARREADRAFEREKRAQATLETKLEDARRSMLAGLAQWSDDIVEEVFSPLEDDIARQLRMRQGEEARIAADRSLLVRSRARLDVADLG